MRKITEIIVHCSATRPGWMAGNTGAERVAEIRRWHIARGWRDIGYHDVIDRDGSVYQGRPHGMTGAHVKGRNKGTLGVCLIGGHGSGANDDPHEHFTDIQLRVLRQYIEKQRRKYPGIQKVSGHNQYAAKACPGFSVPKWMQSWGDLPRTPEALVFHDDPNEKSPGFLSLILSLFGGRK